MSRGKCDRIHEVKPHTINAIMHLYKIHNIVTICVDRHSLNNMAKVVRYLCQQQWSCIYMAQTINPKWVSIIIILYDIVLWVIWKMHHRAQWDWSGVSVAPQPAPSINDNTENMSRFLLLFGVYSYGHVNSWKCHARILHSFYFLYVLSHIRLIFDRHIYSTKHDTV